MKVLTSLGVCPYLFSLFRLHNGSATSNSTAWMQPNLEAKCSGVSHCWKMIHWEKWFQYLRYVNASGPGTYWHKTTTIHALLLWILICSGTLIKWLSRNHSETYNQKTMVPCYSRAGYFPEVWQWKYSGLTAFTSIGCANGDVSARIEFKLNSVEEWPKSRISNQISIPKRSIWNVQKKQKV